MESLLGAMTMDYVTDQTEATATGSHSFGESNEFSRYFNRSFDAELRDQAIEALDQQGVFVLDDVISPALIAQAQQFVQAQLELHGRRYFSLYNPWKLPGSPLHAVGGNPDVVKFLSDLAVVGCNEDAVKDFELYNVLRVLTGAKGLDHSFDFHYDGTVITMLMPIFIPDGPPHESGDLAVYPNRRPMRDSALFNVVEKAFIQNKFTQSYFVKNVTSHNTEAQIIRLKPGSLYFFWGYRTLHANFPCLPENLRATALFFFGDPHPTSWLTKGALAFRKWRETRNLAANSSRQSAG
jgi:hypothetical protein